MTQNHSIRSFRNEGPAATYQLSRNRRASLSTVSSTGGMEQPRIYLEYRLSFRRAILWEGTECRHVIADPGG